VSRPAAAPAALLRLYFATAHQPVAAQEGSGRREGGGVTGEWCGAGRGRHTVKSGQCQQKQEQRYAGRHQSRMRGALGCSGGGEDSIDKPRKCVMESGIFDIHAAHIILYITWVNYSSYGRLSGNGDEQKQNIHREDWYLYAAQIMINPCYCCRWRSRQDRR